MYDNVIQEVMEMPVISVRLNQNEDRLIREYAKLNNLELSKFIRDLVIDYIEDECDSKEALSIISKMKNEDFISFEELAEDLGYDL